MYLNNAAWKRGWWETRKTTVKRANFLVQWNWIIVNKKKISTNTLSLQWKLDALLSLIEMKHKTHNPLLKPFTFCTIFAWFGIYKGFPVWVITPLLALFACWSVSSVKYCKYYLFLNDSPRSSCSVQLHRPVYAKFPLTHLQRPLHTVLHQQWVTS